MDSQEAALSPLTFQSLDFTSPPLITPKVPPDPGGTTGRKRPVGVLLFSSMALPLLSSLLSIQPVAGTTQCKF